MKIDPNKKMAAVQHFFIFNAKYYLYFTRSKTENRTQPKNAISFYCFYNLVILRKVSVIHATSPLTSRLQLL